MAIAYEDCVRAWLNQNPEPSQTGRCACCGGREAKGSVVLPFGASDRAHTWLHAACWPDWYAARRQGAQKALHRLGLQPPSEAFRGSAIIQGDPAGMAPFARPPDRQ